MNKPTPNEFLEKAEWEETIRLISRAYVIAGTDIPGHSLRKNAALSSLYYAMQKIVENSPIDSGEAREIFAEEANNYGKNRSECICNDSWFTDDVE